MSRVAHLRHGQCPTCGKWSYRSRRSARKAGLLLHPSRRLYPYRCGAWWHLSSEIKRLPQPNQSRRTIERGLAA